MSKRLFGACESVIENAKLVKNHAEFSYKVHSTNLGAQERQNESGDDVPKGGGGP
jgi:hypothetical protein